MNKIIARAEKALHHDLCDHCLGRLFAQVESGTTNKERGRDMRIAVALELAARSEEMPPHETCWLCGDLFEQLPRFAETAASRLSEIEYDTFLIGTKVDPALQDREEQLWSEVGGETAEPIKAELNREIGKLVEARVKKEVDFTSPDVVALVDTRFGNVELNIAPLFIYGRYRKHSREIPQTRWPCRMCRGKGCKRCGGIGKMYQTSVQELIGDPLVRQFEGKDHFFHGMGREDIDARMLGTGRPFVLEIAEPRKRHLDLGEMERLANENGDGLADFSRLRWSDRHEVRQIKAATPDKVYRAEVSVQGKVNKERIDEVVESLNQARITQQTPSRVAHRRANLARERTIRELVLESMEEDKLVLRLTTESGTYVKEFVSGDEGRTVPSLAGLLGVPCQVIALDVIQIIDNVNEG
ncbi:MAG: tRNA pseudouridine(54/55) synthase Pus10 [Methanomassiliicoccaceae archaeon]|jgi:tRNA pseudouridine synthase 10|nr:tRNA pseudouridine(54/55) synthase Pus10 [Euryarchaeota archaeon]HOB38210.1 tRNA pseudouridine(54/55) synthase Pus10 [Methanomassiliicoccaceae archaeon]HOL07683.1 tRNA pseudouridine(54/55) synthase Pus10 [Methanomassiliicoccaceae archaeon]HOQ25431.1 tRNA pseudouridine(54/55) synthase Pus10 [Methanomassiliicoccaceae archaeon]HPP44569.1 tRNA pseudouridine(54/55) synthase Pus10 [Methanomassiliicoccaceae archaeon]